MSSRIFSLSDCSSFCPLPCNDLHHANPASAIRAGLGAIGLVAAASTAAAAIAVVPSATLHGLVVPWQQLFETEPGWLGTGQ